MDEEFGSFVVTEPELVDEGIDVSGLRTQTDVNRALLGNVAPGIQYEGIGFNPTALSDLSKFFQFGLPAIDTPAVAVPPATGGGDAGSGDGGQATIPDIDLGGNTPEDQRLIDEGIGLQIAPGQPVVAPGEMPVTQAEMDAENFPELTEEMSEVSIPTPPPFEMPRGGGADIDTFDTTPQDSPIIIQNIGPGREVVQPDGTIINIDPLEEQMLREELRNELEGTDTFTPTLETETIDAAPNIVTAKPPVGVVDPFDGKYTMSTSITPQDTEESITQKIAGFLDVDISKINKAAVTGALNLVAGKALDTVIPIATVFNLVKDAFVRSPEEIAAEEQARQDNIDEAAAITQRLEDEVTPQDIIDDRGRGEIPTRTEPEPTFTPRGGGADRDPAPSAPAPKPTPAAPVYQDAIMRGQTGGGSDPGGGGKSIVCTAMYQTTGLKDWSKAMKIWYIYQKKYLTIQHQEGYHILFKPFVKGMHKSSIIKAIGAHVARHRTQHLKHVMFNSKPSLLGKIYNKILEPICYFVGKHG